MTKKNEFSKATTFIIDSISENRVITRKRYKTKKGFLNRIKALGVKNFDTIKLCKTTDYSAKGFYYIFIWE